MKIRPVILSGGSGTRLWPVSRARHPKQFAELLGKQSLFRSTLQLLDRADLFLPTIIVAQSDHKFFVLDAVAESQHAAAAILLEPCGRNTAAAALIAALAEPEDVIHLLLPSDHIIDDHQSFFDALQKAARAASQKRIALFGIRPAYPETGYGYIVPGASTAWPSARNIESFREKPAVSAAQQLIADGALWNSGIFLYHPQVLIKEARKSDAKQVDLCQQALKNATKDLGCLELQAAAYQKLHNISFDYLIMEKTRCGVVVLCDMGWSDVGSWNALWLKGKQDTAGNVKLGAAITVDSRGCYLRSDGPVIGAIGLDDIAVVATVDAVLVMPRSRSQDVKQLVAKLEENKQNVSLEHRRVMRPWGSYEGVAGGHRFQVKHIHVKPGQSLSLQMHHHRAEHWVVVTGTASVECDGVVTKIYENQSIFIPKGSKHRLSNPGKVDLHVVEVQSGEYLGEDDIVRFADHYGRITAKPAALKKPRATTTKPKARKK